MKKVVMVFFAFLFLVSGVTFISARTHPASEVIVEVDGTDRDLQTFIDNNLIFSGNSFSSPSSVSNPGHSFGDIVVATISDQNGINFLTALSSGEKIIGSEGLEPDTSSLAFGHSASNIIIDESTGETLQEMINDGDLCVSYTCSDLTGQYGTSIDDGCGGSIRCDAPAPTCTVNSYKDCYNNDVYWYDSCGNRGSLVKDCGESGWGGWVVQDCSCFTVGFPEDYRHYYSRGCRNGECYVEITDTQYRLSDCCSVVCTELNRIGLMSDEVYQRDVKFSQEHFSENAIKGYLAWGVSVVKLMRNDDNILNATVLITDSFIKESNYRFGDGNEGDQIGKYYLDNALPLFERIGVLIERPNVNYLFKEVGFVYKSYEFIMRFFRIENTNNVIVSNYITEERVREMFYSALSDSDEFDMEFAISLVGELEKLVEEIEREVL